MQQVANSSTGKAAAGADARLTLSEILDWLLEDKLADAEAAEKLRKERRYYRGTMHPLVIVADQKWKRKRQALAPHARLRSPSGWRSASAWNTCTSIR